MSRLINSKQIEPYVTLSGSFTGSFLGSGANLVDIPAGSILGLQLFQISSGSVSASVNIDSDVFLISSESIDLFKIGNDGVIQLKSQETDPTSVQGGLMYSGSNLWVGIE